MDLQPLRMKLLSAQTAAVDALADASAHRAPAELRKRLAKLRDDLGFAVMGLQIEETKNGLPLFSDALQR